MMSPMRCASWELLSAIDCPLLTLVACPPCTPCTPERHTRAEPDEPRTQQTARKGWQSCRHCHPEQALEARLERCMRECSSGLLWSDCSRDERSGWLQDHHFPASLSQPTQPAASRAGKHLCTGTYKLEHTRGSCAEFRSTASADTPMALAGQQAHGHVCTTRSATVLPTFAAKRA